MALLKAAPHAQEKVSPPWKSRHHPRSCSPQPVRQTLARGCQPTAKKATQGQEVSGPKKVRSQEERPWGLAKIRTYQMDLSTENVISHHRRWGAVKRNTGHRMNKQKNRRK